MSLEFNPVGMACNIQCAYCYEQPMRDAGNINSPLNIDKALAELDKHNQPFSLFGGEPLLLNLKDLETVFKHGYNRWKQNGVQTNGTLITDAHIELFKSYNVHVGFSIDGPWPINSVRCSEFQTETSISNLRRVLLQNISTSLIITLVPAHIRYANLFIGWLSDLDELGLKNARLHLLESDNGVERVPEDELIGLLSKLERIELGFKNLKFDIFQEMYTLLQNPEANATCVWGSCDAYTTAAVQGVGPSGERYNCGRTNKEGINWSKADKSGHERQLALYHTDCKDCKFFLACKGWCPGTAINGDWRRKTEHCKVLYTLFDAAERRLHNSRINTYTQDPNLKMREAKFLKVIQSSDKGCQDHQDWHIDTNAKKVYTGNVPVELKR